MQKRSHKLLASTLLVHHQGFASRWFELAFLFGSFQPDCNPFTYLRGSLHARAFRGHNFSNSQIFINRQIKKLRHRSRWTIRQYYILGKLTHYLADAFTYPHNEHFPGSLLEHRRYEARLRQYLATHLPHKRLFHPVLPQDPFAAIDALHQQYMASASNVRHDTEYILQAAELLIAGCLPAKTFIV